MKALGMICGVGSMLIGAKEQGYDIIGNIEWRDYYHSGTFEYNFPGAFMINTLSDLDDNKLKLLEGLDLIMGHTECGNFSNLRIDKNARIDAEDKGDIPQFIDAVKLLKPKFFAMDNLPKSLMLADWNWYNENLPEYDIHFEWIHNYGYGNIQKHRKRLFVIGSLKTLKYVFIPSEFEHSETIQERIKKIKKDSENNKKIDLDAPYAGWSRYHFDKAFIPKSVEENKLTLREFQGFIKDIKPRGNIYYYNKKGEQKNRIGYTVVNLDGPSPVLAGGGSSGFDCIFRLDDLYPFTIRERAKIQGAPDDFVFLPRNVNTTGKPYRSLIKQTGKFMPVEFCTFLTLQIKDFLEGNIKNKKYTEQRLLGPNEYIDKNKYEYCENVKYSNQKDACKYCGSKSYCKNQKQNKNKKTWREFSKIV